MKIPLRHVFKRTLQIFAVTFLTFAGRSVQAAALTDRAAPLSIDAIHHTAWTIREAVPNNINDIAQTSDGFLWIATDYGLFRFDGSTFARYQPTSGDAFPFNSVEVLKADASGGLWIGYRFGGASYLRGGLNKTFGPSDGLRLGSIAAFLQDGSTVWAATTFGLHRFDGIRWSSIGEQEGLPLDARVSSIFRDRKGTVWAGTTKGIYRLRQGFSRFEWFSSLLVREGESFCLTKAGFLLGLMQTGEVRLIASDHGPVPKQSLVTSLKSEAVLLDSADNLWISTRVQGIRFLPNVDSQLGLPLDDSRFQPVSSVETASNDYAFSLLSDREGNVWAASTKGIEQFRPDVFHQVSMPPGYVATALAVDSSGSLLYGSDELWSIARDGTSERIRGPRAINCLYRDPSGSMWIGGEDGLWKRDRTRISSIKLPSDLSPVLRHVQAMAMDRVGNLWVSFIRDGLYRYRSGTWAKASSLLRLPPARPLVAFADYTGSIWLGYTNQIVRIDGETAKAYGAENGLDLGIVTSISEADGNLWIGGEKGFGFFRNGRFTPVRLRDDTALEGVTGAVATPDGDLWVNQASGVVRIAKSEVDRALNCAECRLAFTLLNHLDGLNGAPEQIRPLPTAALADGRIYFSTRTAAAWLNPHSIKSNRVLPLAFIDSVTSDGRTFRFPLNMRLLAGTQDISIAYTTASLSIPERVKFRYILEGFDKHWQEAGGRRLATYAKLPPGTYTFRVSASNDSDIWSATSAAFQISVPPTFVQTIWFKVGCSLIFLCLAAWLYFARLRLATEAVRKNLFARMAERERIARELHDTLFQSVNGMLLRVHTGTSKLRKDDPARIYFEEILDHSDQIVREGRALVSDLRSTETDTENLSEAISLLGHQLQELHPTRFSMIVEGKIRGLRPDVADELYKLCKEALCNAFQHSEAELATVTIWYGARELTVTVRDNGIGIPDAILAAGQRPGHWGLAGMKERAKELRAELFIGNDKGSGTVVSFRLSANLAFAPGPAATRYRWLMKFRTRIRAAERISDD